MQTLTLESPVSALPGIGKTRAAAFGRMGVFTLRELLYHFPHRYENRGDVRPLTAGTDGEVHAFVLTVANQPRTAMIRRGMTLTKFRAFDESGTVEVVFFNQRYCEEIFTQGSEFRFFGKLTPQKRSYQLNNPAYEPIREGEPLPDFFPRYPLSEGLSQKIVAQAVQAALAALAELYDPLPEPIRQKYEFPTLRTALSTLHDPPSTALLKQALSRLAFDELFTFSLGIGLSHRQARRHSALPCSKQNITPLLSRLPFELTNSQKQAVREIAADMAREDRVPMSRILVGDVGCGKTVCAAIAVYLSFLNGHQSVLMAPTEILARQHFRDLSEQLTPLGLHVELLIGATPAKEKKRIRAALTATSPEERVDLLIGTHALLEDSVSFFDLALTVTDEQHRFGVRQRAALQEKNESAHLLVMSATPIPRTLALVLYGDLDISHITEMPKGRQRVDTHLIGEAERERLNGFIRRQVEEGGQVYIVCPAIEEGEQGTLTLAEIQAAEPTRPDTAPPLKHAVEYAEQLAARFPDLSVAYLHGKMSPADKDLVMNRFAEGKTDILVSTTVIEVGVNVPNASLMVVENAERFGLSQLHQLRGRVGRGCRRSYCILVSDAPGDYAKSRLQTICTAYDGYAIAERDLALRGPGDFFASGFDSALRQSGGVALPLAKQCADTALMQNAFAEAHALLEADPALTAEDNRALGAEVFRLFRIESNTIS